MLRPEKDGYIYYYTKGLSMWPTLISNDILRTERITALELVPGDIVVLPEKNGKQIIHRLISTNSVSEGVLMLFTAGDRSGKDEPLKMNADKELLKVIDVLRKGVWKELEKKVFLSSSKLPSLIVRFHCRIIRKFFW